MSFRSIESIISPPQPHMVGDGFRVHNFIPGAVRGGMERTDPFIMLDYGSKHYFPPSEKPRGVGVHPHRGFETVTIAYHGKVAHHDSAGNSGIIEEGEVQWMTAASGVLHKEYHEKEFSRRGGDFQMVQLWVNLPAKDKMSKPKYQSISKEQIVVYQIPDGKGTIEIIAGEYEGLTGPASTFTPIRLLNARLSAGSEQSFKFPVKNNTAFLVIEGSVTLNKATPVVGDHFVLMRNDGEEIYLKADVDSVILFMSGEPIHEPIAAYGPFVMNTREELVKAFEDMESGKFGHLED